MVIQESRIATRSTLSVALAAFEAHLRHHPLTHYTGILALQGLAHVAVSTQHQGILRTCEKHFGPFVAGEHSFWCNFPNYLCGGNGAALLHWKGYLPGAVDKVRQSAEQILRDAPRDPTGLVRMPGDRVDRVFIDAAFAVTPFLLFAGLGTDDDRYIEEAFRQATGICDVLRDPENGLLHQSRGFVGDGKISQDHWSRGNGWGLLALAELVAWLPDNHRRRPAAEKALGDLLIACLKYQDAQGLWHQEITEPDLSYVETSGTGLILFALGVALERGCVPASRHADFVRGINGYARYVTPGGDVFHTCRDCLSPGDGSKAAYMARPPVLNDAHAFGPVILAFGQAHRIGIEHIGTAS